MILLTVLFLNYLRYDYSGEESNNNVSSSAAKANTFDSTGKYVKIYLQQITWLLITLFHEKQIPNSDFQ